MTRARPTAIAVAIATALVLGGCTGPSSPAPASPGPTDVRPPTPPGGPTRPGPGVAGDTTHGRRYDTGNPALTDIWVDPVAGSDANDGASRARAVRTIGEAWRRIPIGTPLGTGIRIALVAGNHLGTPHYWESRWGTRTAPVVIESVDGPGAARLDTMNVFDVRHMHVVGVTIESHGDIFHCEQCDHLLLRRVTFRGLGDPAAYETPWETVKVNQSTNVYIEDSDISGASDNAVDFVAVQHGHLIGNRIHRALDWCAYAKGGSADISIVSNEIHDCGTGGFTAGQGTGFQFMTEPWTTYEASAVQVVNNVVHDVQGAAFGVAGGFDVAVVHNTAYRVGTR